MRKVFIAAIFNKLEAASCFCHNSTLLEEVLLWWVRGDHRRSQNVNENHDIHMGMPVTRLRVDIVKAHESVYVSETTSMKAWLICLCHDTFFLPRLKQSSDVRTESRSDYKYIPYPALKLHCCPHIHITVGFTVTMCPNMFDFMRLQSSSRY